ncbi:hypothetical protein D3C81_855840 [compost metagenome]
MRDAVVQSLRHQVALFGDGHFAFARGQAQVFQGDAQQLAQGFQQGQFTCGKHARMAEMQVEEAQVLFVGVDVEDGHGGKALAVTFQFMRAVDAAHVVHLGHLHLDCRAAQAVAHLQAVFRCHQFLGQARVHHHVQVAALGVEHAHGGTIGLEIIDDALHEAAADVGQRLRALQESGAFVQQRQFAVAVFEGGRLAAHALFQVAVQRLQAVGHLVEATGQLAEFVIAFDGQAHAEIALLHALHAQAQARDRLDDQHEHQVDHADRAEDGHGQQHHLRSAQPEGALLAIVLDQAHQLIDLADKGIGFMLELACLDAGIGRQRRRTQGTAPGQADAFEFRLDGGTRGQEQGPLRVAMADLGQGVVDQQRLLLRLHAGVAGDQQGQAVGLHAQPARFVDGGRAAFELPRQEQGAADGTQGQHQHEQQRADDLGRQLLPGGKHRLEFHRSFCFNKRTPSATAPGKIVASGSDLWPRSATVL